MKIALVVEYNGTRYHGFEWQVGLPTIQGELERAIRKVTGERRRVIAASRTDAGVHARGQVVSFWTESRLTPPTVVRALNATLPRDIAVHSAFRIQDDFNVRADAISRQYDYCILNRPVRSPLTLEFSHHVMRELDVAKMNRACRLLLGEHDFTSFITSWEEDRSPVRTISEARLKRSGDTVRFRIVANSFLPHQVRNTVGLLTRVGLGKLALKDIKEIMEARKPGLAGPTAPARGLFLTRVNYARPLGEQDTDENVQHED